MRVCLQAERLDILVYAEIGMDPANYLLAFSRLAPHQVCVYVMCVCVPSFLLSSCPPPGVRVCVYVYMCLMTSQESANREALVSLCVSAR